MQKLELFQYATSLDINKGWHTLDILARINDIKPLSQKS